MPKRSQVWTTSSAVWLLSGCALAVFGQACFLVPNRIVPAGLIGLGTVLFHQCRVPIGLFTLVGNLVLIGAQSRWLGWRSSGKTVAAVVGSSLLLDLVTSVLHVPVLAHDPLLAAVYGGLLNGLGIAFVFKGGGTMGGVDILAQLLLRFRSIPVGVTLLWADVVVLGVAGTVFGPDLALYAMIKSFIVSQAIDRVLEGHGGYRHVFVISAEADVIAWGIIEELRHGATLLAGRGAYTQRPVEVVMTAIRRRDIPALEDLVYRLDPQAYIVVNDARRVLGRGFDPLEEEVDPELPASPPEAALGGRGDGAAGCPSPTTGDSAPLPPRLP